MGPAHSYDCQESGSENRGQGVSAHLSARNRPVHHPILGPRNWGPRKSPAKRVLGGEDEQGSERNFGR